MIDEAAIGKAMSRYNKWLSEQNPEKLRARIAELEAALKPFADAADNCDGKDVWKFMWGLKIGDLRAAAAALKETSHD